jgi:acetylxylan esterase
MKVMAKVFGAVAAAIVLMVTWLVYAPPSTPGTCRVTYTVSAWNTGLTTSITIANTGSSPINGWSLAFTLPSGQTITSGWNAAYTPTSGQVTARNVGYNGAIVPNGSVGIGFQATHTGNSGRPASFTLNHRVFDRLRTYA